MKNTIRFWGGQEPATEVLRLSRDGIWANPDIAVDDAAKLVLAAIDSNIKVLVQKAIEAEREACANVAEQFGPNRPIVAARPSERIVGRWEGEQAASSSIAAAIRARGQA